MKISIKKIIFSKVFWIICGIVILFWRLQEYMFFNLFTVEYLVFRGPTVLPLIFPAAYFYLFARKRNEKYFNTTIKFLIAWPIWSYFAAGFFNIAGPRDLSKDAFVFYICPIIVIAVASIAYLFHCGNILNKKGYPQFISKKKSLWLSWLIGLSVIIISSWICMRIGSYLESILGDHARSELRDYIAYLIDLFLMWLIISLPASLKIDAILFKENKE